MVSIRLELEFFGDVDIEELWEMTIKEYIECHYSVDDLLEYMIKLEVSE